MSGILLSQFASLELLDLDAIFKFYGRDFLPYPLMFTRPSRLETRDEAWAYSNTVPDRYNHGDLRIFRDCIAAYLASDIRVECHVQYIPDDTASVRVIGYRTGHLGYLMMQRADADVIDLYRISPYDLSAAICDTSPLTQPGVHPEIVVPEYVPLGQPEYDSEAFVVRHKLVGPARVTVPAREVTAYATVQSHWGPTRNWGRDRRKRAVVWVCVGGDGEYVYAPDCSHAKPLTKSGLGEEIDGLIVEDIEVLRESRGG